MKRASIVTSSSLVWSGLFLFLFHFQMNTIRAFSPQIPIKTTPLYQTSSLPSNSFNRGAPLYANSKSKYTTGLQVSTSYENFSNGSGRLPSRVLQKIRRTATRTTDFLYHKLKHEEMTPVVTKEIQRYRTIAASVVLGIVSCAPWANVQLVRLWSYLQKSQALLPRMFRHDHWEWVLAVSAFFVYIHGFWLVDRRMASTAKKGVRHPWRKYRLQDQYAAQQHERKVQHALNRGDSLAAKELDEAGPPMPKLSKWHAKAFLFEVPLYIVPLYIWDVLAPRRAARIATFSAPTVSRIATDIVGGLLLYDFVFFFAHWTMHKVPIFYRWFHKKHHESKEVRACDQVRLSGVEEFVDVGISIWALRFLGAHPVSRTIYNLIITFLLTELHCGYVSGSRLFPRNVFIVTHLHT